MHRDEGRTDDSRLLILDFDGVCFDSARRSIDEAAESLVRDARAAGIVVAVLSNELDDETLTNSSILNEVHHVVVCATGIQKPDRRAFQRVMLLAGIDAEHTVAVDDSAINLRGAEAAGAGVVAFDTHDRSGSWADVRRELGLDDET